MTNERDRVFSRDAEGNYLVTVPTWLGLAVSALACFAMGWLVRGCV